MRHFHYLPEVEIESDGRSLLQVDQRIGKLATTMNVEWKPSDLDDLQAAKGRLEYPSLTARISALLGKPIEIGLKLLPGNWNDRVREITQAALLHGLEFSISTLGNKSGKNSKRLLHKALVFGSGTAGGAFGALSAAVELPISTCIMLRSIANIARSEGHDITRLETKFACLEVFALGGKSKKDDAFAEGYWAVRSALAKEISNAMRYIAEKGLSQKSAPPLVRLLTSIAARFSIVVTEETAAKLVPAVGAVSGGVINVMFMHHFQEMAKGHFSIKRLEKTYGSEAVRKKYDALEI